MMAANSFSGLLLSSALLWAGALSLTGCGDIAEQINDGFTQVLDTASESLQQPAEATSVGLDLSEPYPDRSQEYDGWLPEVEGLQSWQLEKLEFDVAMPQSEGALQGFLGEPYAEQGDWKYWKIASGSSELAIEYANGVGVRRTYGMP